MLRYSLCCSEHSEKVEKANPPRLTLLNSNYLRAEGHSKLSLS
uniref:Uncharacterized protein n=1 Tax=Arundo donax TaxID=35708 RepID=A0A0A9AEH7_ARUDO